MSKYRYTEPIPMPRGTKYGSNYWIFYSYKLNRRVTAYSSVEYENLLTLEMNPDVEYFCEQPTKITVQTEAKEVSAIPDVWVLYKNGREEIQEVKAEDPANNRTEQGFRDMEQIRREKEWCKLNHFDFKLRTREDVHLGQYYILNLKYLYGRLIRSKKPDKHLTNKVISYLLLGIHTVESITDKEITSPMDTMDVLAHLYYEGIITIKNLDSQVLQNNSEVFINGTTNI